MAPIILTEKDKVRFFSKLKRNEATGCLEWTASRKGGSYGGFKLNGKIVRAHRVAFLLAGGSLSDAAPHVCHTCDNPLCCEPTHLFAGSVSDNALDRERKGRGHKGRRGLPYGVTVQTNGRFQAVVGRPRSRKNYCLGTFDTPEEASAVALAFRMRTRGY